MILRVFSILHDPVTLYQSKGEIHEENVRNGKSIEMLLFTLIFLLVMNLTTAPEISYSFLSFFSKISWLKSRWPSLNSYLGTRPISSVLMRCSPCINPLRKISKKVQKVAREKRARDESAQDEEIRRHLLDWLQKEPKGWGKEKVNYLWGILLLKFRVVLLSLCRMLKISTSK